MKNLLSCWNKLSRQIKKSPHTFLFFDYDGTLTPIVSRPEKAKCPHTIKFLIKRLQEDPRFTIAVISGRSLKDVKKMVGIKGITYAGNHGLQIEKPSGRVLRPKGVSTGYPLKKIKRSLKKKLNHIKGAWIEDKGLTLSVHFRLVDKKKITSLKKIFRNTVAAYVLSKKIRVSSGKMVLEVRPGVEWDKGKAVLELLGSKKGLTLYLGDDVTDMDVFRAIKGKGISIFVGSPRSGIGADYSLKNPKEVELFLKKLQTV